MAGDTGFEPVTSTVGMQKNELHYSNQDKKRCRKSKELFTSLCLMFFVVFCDYGSKKLAIRW
jgi:hypothetical protein